MLSLLNYRFVAAVMALRMESAPTAARQATSASSSLLVPQRQRLLCPFRPFPAVSLLVRHSLVRLVSRCRKWQVPRAQPGREVHHCLHPQPAPRPTRPSPSSPKAATLATRLVQATILRRQKMSAAEDAFMKTTMVLDSLHPTRMAILTRAVARQLRHPRAAPRQEPSTNILPIMGATIRVIVRVLLDATAPTHLSSLELVQ